jgi:hypothetical protein
VVFFGDHQVLAGLGMGPLKTALISAKSLGEKR